MHIQSVFMTFSFATHKNYISISIINNEFREHSFTSCLCHFIISSLFQFVKLCNINNKIYIIWFIFQIIWFTALFPYFVMAILLVRALTLPGAFTGLYYYVRVDWSRLLMGQTWIDGATQIFFAYSCGMGALPALGSYNKFHHNCYK